MQTSEVYLNALLAFILSGVLLAGFGVQFLEHEKPCPLCLLQRIGMLGAATGALCNVRFGIYATHYSAILFSSLAGGIVALRQISLHICPEFPTFGFPILGLSLYTWSFIVFACTVTYTAFLLLFFTKNQEDAKPINSYSLQFVFWLTFIVTLANVWTTWGQCGFGPCQDVP